MQWFTIAALLFALWVIRKAYKYFCDATDTYKRSTKAFRRARMMHTMTLELQRAIIRSDTDTVRQIESWYHKTLEEERQATQATSSDDQVSTKGDISDV